MLAKKYLIPVILLASVVIGAADYFLFALNPGVMFIIHNFLALSIGFALVYISYYLIKTKSNSKNYFLIVINLFAGFSMILIHAIKLLMDTCR